MFDGRRGAGQWSFLLGFWWKRRRRLDYGETLADRFHQDQPARVYVRARTREAACGDASEWSEMLSTAKRWRGAASGRGGACRAPAGGRDGFGNEAGAAIWLSNQGFDEFFLWLPGLEVQLPFTAIC
jgi:hypothetical protein